MPANPLLREFHEQLLARYPVDGVGMPTSEWIVRNTTHRGRRFSFKGYEYQLRIADDLHPDLSVIKPSQVGMTEIQVRKFLTLLARNRGRSGIFTLPNEAMYKRVSKTRIRPLVTQEKAFNVEGYGDEPARAMNLYEINGSYGYVTGMVEGDATSIPADFLMHDEIDLSDQQIIALYQSRLQNSDWKITQAFSTPTHAGFGIDARYQTSDQHEYFVKCGACGHHQVPLFAPRFVCLPGYTGDDLFGIQESEAEELDLDGAYFRCERCSRRLDLEDPGMREWVPKYPTRRSRGYRIRPSCVAALTPGYILGRQFYYRKLDNEKGYRNTVHGDPYSDADSKLDSDTIRKLMISPTIPEIGRDVPCAVGIDVGNTCHLTLGPIYNDIPQPARFELVPANQVIERVTELCDQYNIVCGSMDRHPFTPTAEAVFQASKGRILPTEYRGSALVNIIYDEYESPIIAQVNRTAVIDAVVRAFRRQTFKLCGYGAYGALIEEHLQDMVRVEADEKPATWEKLTGQDHFFHSLAFLLASVRIRNVIRLEDTEVERTELGIFGIEDLTRPPDPRAHQPHNLGFRGRMAEGRHTARIY